MEFFIGLVAVLVAVFILSSIISLTSNYFVWDKKQFKIWIPIMFFLGLSLPYLGSVFHKDPLVPLAISLIAGINALPKDTNHTNYGKDKSANESIDELFEAMGLKNGRKLYRIGVMALWLGSLVGWVIFYGQIV
ncbi:MAG: hypothetical protein WCP14_04415 [bacterium]